MSGRTPSNIMHRHGVVYNLTGQLLLVGCVLIWLRFMRDRSVLLAFINLMVLSVTKLIGQIIDNQYEMNTMRDEEGRKIVCNTVGKLNSNLQSLIVIQNLYSIWYHYEFIYKHPDKTYRTIFLFLIEDEFPLNEWPTLTCFVIEMCLLFVQLISLNIHTNRLNTLDTSGVPVLQFWMYKDSNDTPSSRDLGASVLSYGTMQQPQ